MEEKSSQATVPAQADCWFLNTPFKSNMVYNQLTSMNYDCVVGLDVGAGESMAYISIKEKNIKEESPKNIRSEPLNLDGNYARKIHSMLAFYGQSVIIGNEASAPDYNEFVEYFKRSPKKWDKSYHEDEEDTEKCTYRDLMKAFIRQLWNQILRYNSDEGLDEAVKAKKLLITVGCPASTDWTSRDAMEKYRELVQEATGCDHVVVLPESTAAIISAILKPETKSDSTEEIPETKSDATKKIDYEKGIAILDAGASTIDFTFVLLGKVLITMSMSIGGHRLDEMMLETAKEDTVIANLPKSKSEELKDKFEKLEKEFSARKENVLKLLGKTENDLKEELRILNEELKEKKQNIIQEDPMIQEEELKDKFEKLEKEFSARKENVLKLLGKTENDLKEKLRILNEELIEKKQNIIQEDPMIQEEMSNLNDKIPKEQKSDLLVQMRAYKEDFYPDQRSRGKKTINIWGYDENHKGDRDLDSSLQLSFRMDKAFMERAMQRTFSPKGVLGGKEKTCWKKVCREFIKQTKEKIEKYGCSQVVITGGTSQVVQWRELVEEVYPGLVVRSQNPASSVARGLCCAKILEMNSHDYVEQFKASILEKANKGYQEFAEAFALYAADIACDELHKTALDYSREKIDIKKSDFMGHVTAKIMMNDAMIGERGERKIVELFSQAFGSIQEGVYKDVDAVSGKIYGPMLSSNSRTPTVPNRDIIKNMKFTPLINAAVIGRILNPNLGNTKHSIASALVVFLMSGDRHYLSELCESDFNEITAEIEKDRKSYVSRISKRFYKQINKMGIGKEEFQSYVQQQAEIALGKVLFLVFDEKPQSEGKIL